MSKNQITIAKPDKSRSCWQCRKSIVQLSPNKEPLYCSVRREQVSPDAAKTCHDYRDARTTSQVISAGGKVGPA